MVRRGRMNFPNRFSPIFQPSWTHVSAEIPRSVCENESYIDMLEEEEGCTGPSFQSF